MAVDDNPDILESIKTILLKEGHEVETADCGEELIKNLDKFDPVLILLDVMMPGYTLQQTLEEVEKRDKYKIILVTVVRFMDEKKNEIFKNKCVIGYVTKPFNLMDLLGEINKAIAK